jgi:hypothetical protein
MRQKSEAYEKKTIESALSNAMKLFEAAASQS